jgi:hypothetical protein
MAIPAMLTNKTLNDFGSRLQQMFACGQLSADEFFEASAVESARLYLSQTEPMRQSGHGGDLYYWRHVRGMILEAVYLGGTFVDIGCANGHLIESLDRWLRPSEVGVEFHGLEISPDLHRLAVRRLPEFAPRLHLGNGVDWRPPIKFDYVYTMTLPDLPGALRKRLLDNLWSNCLKQGGRLILGPWYGRGLESELADYGYSPSGYCEKTCPGSQGPTRRIVWVDKPSEG